METRFEPTTEFGKWILAKKKSVVETARLLNVSRSYVYLLATGKATPSMKMASKIQAYTLGAVQAQTWVAVANKL